MLWSNGSTLLALSILTILIYMSLAEDSADLSYNALLNVNFHHLPLNMSGIPHAVKNVTVLHNSSSTSAIHAAISKRVPFVMTNHSAKQWPALNWDLLQMSASGQWTHLFGVLSLEVKKITACKDGTNSKIMEPSVFFTRADSAEGGNIRHTALGSPATAPKLINEMTMRYFLGNITLLQDSNNSSSHTGKVQRYLYSTEFDGLEEELQLYNDTAWQTLLINEIPCVEVSTACNLTLHPGTPANASEQPSPRLHLLHPGAALQSGVAEYHVMRVQLQGTGRYYLSPPQHAAHPLHVFPSVHECAGLAQVNFYEREPPQPCASAGAAVRPRTPLFSEYARNFSAQQPAASRNSSNAVQVVQLRAGDVLYVPPYWSMHTEAASLSVLLDVLSLSQEQLLLTPAYYMEMPFVQELTQSKHQRVVSAQVFLVHVLSRVHGVFSVQKYAQALYRSRYSALFPENGLFLRKRKQFQCLRDQPVLYNSIVDKLDPHKIAAAAAFVASKVNSAVFGVGQPQSAVKWTWLANYIEQLARWAMMGDGEEVVLFIRECLFMDDVLKVVEEVLGPTAMQMQPDELSD